MKTVLEAETTVEKANPDDISTTDAIIGLVIEQVWHLFWMIFYIKKEGSWKHDRYDDGHSRERRNSGRDERWPSVNIEK